jgi:hypothetical protein
MLIGYRIGHSSACSRIHTYRHKTLHQIGTHYIAQTPFYHLLMHWLYSELIQFDKKIIYLLLEIIVFVVQNIILIDYWCRLGCIV